MYTYYNVICRAYIYVYNTCNKHNINILFYFLYHIIIFTSYTNIVYVLCNNFS